MPAPTLSPRHGGGDFPSLTLGTSSRGLILCFSRHEQPEHFRLFGDQRLEQEAVGPFYPADCLPSGENLAVVIDLTRIEAQLACQIIDVVPAEIGMQLSQDATTHPVIEGDRRTPTHLE